MRVVNYIDVIIYYQLWWLKPETRKLQSNYIYIFFDFNDFDPKIIYLN